MLSSEQGSYHSFHIDINENIDFNKAVFDFNKIVEIPVFAHEYIHFMQEITSAYGLFKFNHRINEINALAYEWQQNGVKTKHKKPYEKIVKESMIPNFNYNVKLYNIIENDDYLSIDSDFTIDSIAFEDTMIDKNEMNTQTIPVAKLISKKGETFRFSNKILCESMAHLFERIIYDCPKLKGFEYNACRQIVNYYELEISDECLLAICELSLCSFYVAGNFVDLLNIIKRRKITLNKMTDIEKFLNPKDLKNPNMQYQQDLQIAFDNIDWAFSIQQYTKDANYSIKSLFALGNYHRSKNPLLLSKIFYYENQNDRINYLKWLFLSYGIPAFTHKMREYSSFPCQFEKNLINNTGRCCLGLNSFEYYLKHWREDRKACYLYNYCQQRDKSSKMGCFNTNLCQFQPLEVAKKSNEACPLSYYFARFGLDKPNI